MWGQKGLFPFRSKGNGECAVCPRFIHLLSQDWRMFLQSVLRCSFHLANAHGSNPGGGG
jgi:hypothetical protein